MKQTATLSRLAPRMRLHMGILDILASLSKCRKMTSLTINCKMSNIEDVLQLRNTLISWNCVVDTFEVR